MPAELLNARPAPTLCIGQRVIKLEMVSKNNKHQKKNIIKITAHFISLGTALARLRKISKK